jgi:hypothetical protein
MTLKKSNKEYNKEQYQKNKEQIKEQRKGYYLKNKEHIREQQKGYNLKNPEIKKERDKKYRLKNKEFYKKWRLENKEHIRNYERNRYQTDVNFKLRKICRNRIRKALKGATKSAATMELIGCTIDELRRHMESKFEPWMNWENHGLWDVEHIKAMSKFDLTDSEQQRACCHWSNLQPMEHIANIKKGDRW